MNQILIDYLLPIIGENLRDTRHLFVGDLHLTGSSELFFTSRSGTN